MVTNALNTSRGTILQIAPTPFFADRGCHIRIEGIVRSLSNLGYHNVVCTYHHGRDIDGVVTARITPIKNYTQTAAGPSKYKLWADWKLLWTAVKQYRLVKPVAIHAHLHEGVMIALALKTIFFWKRTPLIADIQGSLSGELEAHGSFEKLPFLKWPTKQLERLLLLCAKHIVCSSVHSLNQIKGDFGINEDKLSLAQDGADAVDLMPSEQRQELLTDLAIPSKKCIVVYSGALLDAKGLDELKQVIVGCSENKELHFLIIGYPTQDLAAYLEKNQLSNVCTLTGQLPFESLAKYLGIADIAIDPKRSNAGEGSGKMLNYLASSLPVVAFNTRNNKDFLPEDTILANSIDDMIEQLNTLASHQGLRRETAKRNLSHFEDHYSWDVTKEQLNAVYTNL